MNRRSLLSALALTALPTLGVAATDEPAAESLQKENADLRAKVRGLEDQVIALQRELAALRAQRPILTSPPTAVPNPSRPMVPVQPGTQVPNNWQQREFNGMTYYVVPLKDR
jgi:hypothetical protein